MVEVMWIPYTRCMGRVKHQFEAQAETLRRSRQRNSLLGVSSVSRKSSDHGTQKDPPRRVGLLLIALPATTKHLCFGRSHDVGVCLSLSSDAGLQLSVALVSLTVTLGHPLSIVVTGVSDVGTGG